MSVDLSCAAPELIACLECDLVQTLPRPIAGRRVVCARCGAHLERARGKTTDVLPLVFAAGILFVLANTAPIVAIEAAGARSSVSLLGAVLALGSQNLLGVAIIVALTTFAAPAAELLLLAYVLCALACRRRLWGIADSMRWLKALRPWAMVEVFMLGVLVSVVKLAGLAHVIPGIGLWSLCGLIILTAAAHTVFDAHDYWERFEALE